MTIGAYDISTLPVANGRVEAIGAPFGPAGLSMLELDGNVWGVDHADPTKLVILDAEPGSAPGLAIVNAAFGTSATRPSGGTHMAPANGDGVDVRVEVSPVAPLASAAGRLVLLAEMVDNPTALPLMRIAAAVDLARPDAEMDSELRRLIVIDALRVANALAPHVTDLHRLVYAEDLGSANRLADRCDDAATTLGAFGGELRHLAARLREWVQGRESEPLTALPYPDSYSRPIPGPMGFDAARPGPAAPPAEDYLEITMHSDSRVQITVSRAREEGWVEVRRRDDDLLLSLVPLVQSDLLKTADALVPPGLDAHDLDIDVLTEDQLPVPPNDPLAATRRAIRAGRSAARADRLGDIGVAQRRWSVCADRWAEAGDMDRHRAARQRASGAVHRGEQSGWTADEVAEILGME